MATAMKHRTTPVTRLGQWRAVQGLGLRELAGLLDVSPAMLSRVERGQRQLSLPQMIRIARRLRVPIHQLFELTDSGEVA